MRIQEIITESVNKVVYRVDSKPIEDFSNLNPYKHTDDWSQSGLDTGDDSYWKEKNITPKTSRGLFAFGDKKRTALYATGNANQTRYVEYTENGKSYVFFDKKDVPILSKRKTYLTTFDAKNFKQVPSGEFFSTNPGKPVKQETITDPFAYIRQQGWNIVEVDDLKAVLKDAIQKKEEGKILRYGAEGMN